MNYKNIIKNKKIRLKILDFIPDKMIYIQSCISTGRYLNLLIPKHFTEKLQWYKLYYINKLLTQCTDKYLVRDYILSRDIYPETSDLGLFLKLKISISEIIVSPKYINYDRQKKQSIILKECDYLKEHNLDIKSFEQYSKEYSKIRIRKKNPRPILYKDSDFINSLKFKS